MLTHGKQKLRFIGLNDAFRLAENVRFYLEISFESATFAYYGYVMLQLFYNTGKTVSLVIDSIVKNIKFMTKATFFATLLIIILMGCSSKEDNGIEHFIKANEFYKKNDYKSAIKAIDQAIKSDSINYDFYILKAKICQEEDNDDQSIEILNSVASKNFKLDTVNYLLGQAHFGKSGFYKTKKEDAEKENEYQKKAIIYYNKAIKINSNYFSAFCNKQKVLHNLELYDDALITLNRAILIFPESMELISSRGIKKNILVMSQAR